MTSHPNFQPDSIALAGVIEASDGLALMRPEGPVQLGIRKTAIVIAALRSQSLPSSPDASSFVTTTPAVESTTVKEGAAEDAPPAIQAAKIIDPEAWAAIADGRDAQVGSLWANRRLWARNKAEAILALVPQRSGVQSRDAIKALSEMFSESVHETWTKDEIVNIIEDAIVMGSPSVSSASQAGVQNESDRSGLGMVDVHVFADVYTFCFDDGRTYTPTDHEKAMLEDAINGYIAECEQRQAEAAPSVSSAMSQTPDDLCAGGIDPGWDECPKCGATMDDTCAFSSQHSNTKAT